MYFMEKVVNYYIEVYSASAVILLLKEKRAYIKSVGIGPEFTNLQYRICSLNHRFRLRVQVHTVECHRSTLYLYHR